MNDLEKLLTSELRDIYDGEQQLLEALPEMESRATSAAVKEALHEHLEQTKTHAHRLEQVFQEIGETPKRKSCQGIQGIVLECQKMVKDFAGSSVLDTVLITSAQEVEHYEIATYEALRSWATALGEKEALRLLEDNLSEEKRTDKALTLLAEVSRNPAATKWDSPKRTDEEAAFAKAISHGP